MPDVPEFYVDQFRMNVNPYGTAITFGLSSPHPTTGQPQVQDTVLLRMSLEHMKIMSVMGFRRTLRLRWLRPMSRNRLNGTILELGEGHDDAKEASVRRHAPSGPS